MDLHAFLRAQAWLHHPADAEQRQQEGAGEAEHIGDTSGTGGARAPLRVTAWSGWAALHLSLTEQYSTPSEYQGARRNAKALCHARTTTAHSPKRTPPRGAGAAAPDALPLAFAPLTPCAHPGSLPPPPPPVATITEHFALAVQLSLASHHDPCRQALRLTLVVAGQPYALCLPLLRALVLPASVLSSLAPSSHEAAARMLRAAPPTAPPHLALIFPHVCLTIHADQPAPRGQRSPLSPGQPLQQQQQQQDPGQLGRMAQLLVDCWHNQRQRRHLEGAVGGGGSSNVLAGLPGVWHERRVSDWLAGMCTVGSAVQGLAALQHQQQQRRLGAEGLAHADQLQRLCGMLAEAARALERGQEAAEAAMPALQCALAAQQQQLLETAVKQGISASATLASIAAAFERVVAAQAAATAAAVLGGVAAASV